MRWLLLVALLLASGVARADVPISDDARREFAAGVDLLEDPSGPRYREAFEAFHRAYAASPSPKILSNLGLCAMMLERDGEAIEAYQRYLREAPDIDPREREKIERDLATLRAGAAQLSLRVEPARATVVDTRTPPSGAQVVNRYEIENGRLDVGIRAGKHRLEVQAADRAPESWTLEVRPGTRHERKVALRVPGSAPAPQPPVPPPSPDAPAGGGLSAGTITTIVLTGAVAIGAVVVGSLALKYQADYKAFDNGGDREDAERVRSTGEALNITTDVLIAAAVLGAAVSTVLLVLDLTGDDAAAAFGPNGAVLRF